MQVASWRRVYARVDNSAHVRLEKITPDLYPGVRRRVLWQGVNGERTEVLETDPGARFLRLDDRRTGPGESYVLTGVFNDGERDHRPALSRMALPGPHISRGLERRA